MKDQLKEKVDKLVSEYLDCAIKAADDFKNGKPVDDKSIYALGESIRILHHLGNMGFIEIKK